MNICKLTLLERIMTMNNNLSYQSNFIASKRIAKGRPVALHDGQVEPCKGNTTHRFIGVCSLGCKEGEAVNLYDLHNGAVPIYIDDDTHFEPASIDHFGIYIDDDGHTILRLMSNLCLSCMIVSYDSATHIAMGLF